MTADRARAMFIYDPATGALIWRSGRLAGRLAGTLKDTGYRQVYVSKLHYPVHRIIWLMETGAWPSGVIDHIDGHRSNNRWTNLRDVSISVNAQNQKRAMSNNKTGALGVFVDRGVIRMAINIDGKQRYFSGFESVDEAHQAYVKMKRVHHEGCTL